MLDAVGVLLVENDGRPNPCCTLGGAPTTGRTSSISTGITIGLPVGLLCCGTGALVCAISGVNVPLPESVITTSDSSLILLAIEVEKLGANVVLWEVELDVGIPYTTSGSRLCCGFLVSVSVLVAVGATDGSAVSLCEIFLAGTQVSDRTEDAGSNVGSSVLVGWIWLLTEPMECMTVMSNTEGSVGSVIISGSSAVFIVVLVLPGLSDRFRNTGNQSDTGPVGTFAKVSVVSVTGTSVVRELIGVRSWLPSSVCSITAVACSKELAGVLEVIGPSWIRTIVDGVTVLTVGEDAAVSVDVGCDVVS